jgi:hypothetical protein
MGYLGYQFIGKSPEIDAGRRSLLDQYANLAQLSQLLFILAIPFIKLTLAVVIAFLWNGNKSNHNISADRVAILKPSQKDRLPKLSRTMREMESILSREVIKGYGSYEQWGFGLIWAVWLLFLSINKTAPGV